MLLLSLLWSSLSAFALIGGKLDLDLELDSPIIHLILDNYQACTATKIAPNLLITAAHCVDNKNLLAFSSDRSKYNPIFLEKKIIHPSYEVLVKDFNFSNQLKVLDVAIVRIKESVEFNALPNMEIDFSYLSTGSEVSFYGYGCEKSIIGSHPYSPRRKVAHTITLPESMIKTGHGSYTDSYRKHSKDIYRNNLVTAGARLKLTEASLCHGDSGGPVVRERKLVGVNSLYTFDDVSSSGQSISGVSRLNLHNRLSIIKDWIEHNSSP